MSNDPVGLGYSHARSLDGHVVIVTGSARGIGRGVAGALLDRGASVVMTDVLADRLTEAAAQLVAAGHRVDAVPADLRDPGAAATIVDFALERFGSVHGLVNDAMATNEPKPFVDLTADDLALDYDVGPRATFSLMQAVFPPMSEAGGGSIVNFGSGSGTGGAPGWGAYAGAKEAVRGMGKVAALEWGEHGIRVNTICPFADSESVQRWRKYLPEDYRAAVDAVPLRRIGRPQEDVGALVAFLLGDDSTFITAQTIFVDGGSGTSR